MTKCIIKMAAVLAIVACVCAAQVHATVYGVGDSSSGEKPTQLSFKAIGGSHWDVRDPGGFAPLQLFYSPDAGPLEKSLLGIDFTSDQFSISEYFQVNQGPAWTDWHEQFVTPGCVWTGNPILTIENTGDEIAGIISHDGTQVDFIFPSPLGPGTAITINKDFAIGDYGVGTPESVIINQWPTVPEPGTIVLLATALLSLAGYVWRKRK